MADTPTTSAFTPTSSRAQSRRPSISSQISNLSLTPTATPRCVPHDSRPKEQTPPKYREFHILDFTYVTHHGSLELSTKAHAKYQVRDDGISMSTKLICEALYAVSDTEQFKEIRDLLSKESDDFGQEMMITYCELQKEILYNPQRGIMLMYRDRPGDACSSTCSRFSSIILEFRPIQKLATCDLVVCPHIQQIPLIGKGMDPSVEEEWKYEVLVVPDDLEGWYFSETGKNAALATTRSGVISAGPIRMFRLNQLINRLQRVDRRCDLVLKAYYNSVVVLVDRKEYDISFFCTLHFIPPHIYMDASQLESFQRIPPHAPAGQTLPAQFYPSNTVLCLSVPRDNLSQKALWTMQTRHRLNESTKESIAKYLDSLDALAETKTPHFVTRIDVSSKNYYTVQVADNRREIENFYKEEDDFFDLDEFHDYGPKQLVYTLKFANQSYGGTNLETVVLEIGKPPISFCILKASSPGERNTLEDLPLTCHRFPPADH